MSDAIINVTKSYLPQLEKYNSYLKILWETKWLTNRGAYVNQLEKEINLFLGIENTLFVGNGTIAIQIAIKALEVSGEIITTPFSYVATTTSILWENCEPVFADIEEQSLCINPLCIEALITPRTTAILATHVYGNPCDVEAIESIANKYGLKVIYDAAHAFGVTYNGQSIMNYGDVSTCSFHATKLFHTVEGGAIFSKDKATHEKMFLLHTFGHMADDYYVSGINGKNSEFHAAMGLCNLPAVSDLIQLRKSRAEIYTDLLKGTPLYQPIQRIGTNYNYAYYPVVFENENVLLNVMSALKADNINSRRYFYPSLNQLPYIKTIHHCPISESVSKRVLSLPLYHDLEEADIKRIADIIKKKA